MSKYPTRMETLSDGIFAIAMTLLVLSIEVPTLPGAVTPAIFTQYVVSILPQIFIYIVSFFLLAVFWMNHHIFFFLKSTDITLRWINIIWLMAIAIVPFSTSVVGKYGQFQLSQIIFDVNMLVIGIVYYAIWAYAIRNDLVVDKIVKYSGSINQFNLLFIVLVLIAIIVSFISPSASIFLFLLVPVTSTIYMITRNRAAKKTK